MGAVTRVSLNRKGIRALLVAPGVRADITRRAASVAAACNEQSAWGGYLSGAEEQNKKRASANVWTIDTRATADQARSNRLIRNLEAGR